jgi:uncharacterized protein
MQMGLPVSIRASAAVARGECYEAVLALAQLPRLHGVVQEAAEGFAVRLQFSQARQQWRLDGQLNARLALQCRRCDALYEHLLEADIALRLVRTEAEERALLADCEPYWVEQDEVHLVELVEDEILLALPMLPRCRVCEESVQAQPRAAQNTEARRESPFAVLKKM